jgi:hypothetical protein
MSSFVLQAWVPGPGMVDLESGLFWLRRSVTVMVDMGSNLYIKRRSGAAERSMKIKGCVS